MAREMGFDRARRESYALQVAGGILVNMLIATDNDQTSPFCKCVPAPKWKTLVEHAQFRG